MSKLNAIKVTAIKAISTGDDNSIIMTPIGVAVAVELDENNRTTGAIDYVNAWDAPSYSHENLVKITGGLLNNEGKNPCYSVGRKTAIQIQLISINERIETNEKILNYLEMVA